MSRERELELKVLGERIEEMLREAGAFLHADLNGKLEIHDQVFDVKVDFPEGE